MQELQEHAFWGQIARLHSSGQPEPQGPGLQPTLHELPPHWDEHRALPGLQNTLQNVLEQADSQMHKPPQQSQGPNGFGLQPQQPPCDSDSGMSSDTVPSS